MNIKKRGAIGLGAVALVAVLSGCGTTSETAQPSPSPSPACTWSGDRATVYAEGDTFVTAPTVYRDGTVEFLNMAGTGYVVDPQGEVTWLTQSGRGSKLKLQHTVLDAKDEYAIEYRDKAKTYRALARACVEG